MNSNTAALRAEIHKDIEKIGLEQYRLNALNNLELKTVVKVWRPAIWQYQNLPHLSCKVHPVLVAAA